ncbi:MAG: 1-acyl-sn-glycerol-3-phosphate acyltransferase, partial [Alphaproteobacteria bacterium]
MKEFVRLCLRTILKLMKAKCIFNFDINKLPKKGVYVVNHVSYLDPILLFAFLPGNPVFALNGHLYRRHWISFLMQRADVIQFNPIEPADIKKLIAKVDEGRLVVIFAEGRITEDGGLMKIYEAPGLVADKSKAPLIPVWIDGPQYGYFSKTKGKLPHRPLPKMRIYVGEPRSFKLKDDLRRQRDHISNEVYMILREMGFKINYDPEISLFAQLMKTAKVYSKSGWFLKRPRIIEDINRKKKSYKDIIIAAFALGKCFNKFTKHDENVGVLLPNAIATICAFFGLSAYERTPVMINFSVGVKNMLSMCNTAQLKTIITSKTFIIKGKMENVIEEIENAGYK